MTTQSRIAAFLSTSALCLGLAAAPSAHAAPQAAQPAQNGQAAKTAKHKGHAQKPGAKKADAHAARPAPAPSTMK